MKPAAGCAEDANDVRMRSNITRAEVEVESRDGEKGIKYKCPTAKVEKNKRNSRLI